ncbi:MAG: serine hydrolase domain-containing protein [Pyrinomonadaceae bacterium]
MKTRSTHSITQAISLTLLATLFASAQSLYAQVPDKAKVVAGAERGFEKIAKAVTLPAPGCAVGVSLNGESVFEKAFGLAEMEHNIPNSAQTIFESGSVAKQFTAAALVLLQQEGKLSIDDPVKKYIPELPDYGVPLTIRHILNHTAGLRDWGSVMALTGAGRGDRVISQEMAVDVILRQKHLDFKPGTEYSYSNSGYQLAAEIVERVSKQKFPAFVEERFFKPLGMKNSSTRDNFQRLVPGRAQAYARAGANAPWELNMPFMNVYGNGGMLTTVGDWLKWNAMLDSRSMGGWLVDALETQGITNGDKKIAYALGISVGSNRGFREVSHSGSTAGYQTFLTRYPDKKVSIAVLCNGTSPSATSVANAVADEIFGAVSPATPPQFVQPAEEKLKKFVGVWRNEKNHFPGTFTFENGGLRFNGGAARFLADDTMLLGGTRVKVGFDKDGRPMSAESTENDGSITRFVAETEWKLTPDDIKQFAGDWYSEEAQAGVSFTIEGGKPFIVNKPVIRMALQPVYKDHFVTPGYIVWFTRDRSGKIERMHVGTGRMRDMWFERVKR